MALFSACITTIAYASLPIKPVGAHIYAAFDFSSFLERTEIARKNCNVLQVTTKSRRVAQRGKGDRANEVFPVFLPLLKTRSELVEPSNARRCTTNYYMLSLEKLCKEIRGESVPVHARANDRWHGEYASRPIHPHVFSLLVRLVVIYSVLPSACSFAPTFPVITSCVSREMCVTVNETQRVRCMHATSDIFIVSRLASSRRSRNLLSLLLFPTYLSLFRFVSFSGIILSRRDTTSTSVRCTIAATTVSAEIRFIV